MQLNTNPIRVRLEQTTSKGLFKKKEVTSYAVGDENGKPLTEFVYIQIEPYADGFAAAAIRTGSIGCRWTVLDLGGNQIIKEYADSFYDVRKEGELLTITSERVSNKGVANLSGKVLIDPKDNDFLSISGDVIIHGRFFNDPNIMDNSSLGAARVIDGELVEIVPRGKRYYNIIENMGDGYLAVGRIVVKRDQAVSSGPLPGYTTTYQPKMAVRFYSVTGGPVSDKVFGFTQMPKRSRDGKINAVYFPKITPEQLIHSQTHSEAFSGTGLLDFSGAKNVRLDAKYQII